jgi:hypothetical protein
MMICGWVFWQAIGIMLVIWDSPLKYSSPLDLAGKSISWKTKRTYDYRSRHYPEKVIIHGPSKPIIAVNWLKARPYRLPELCRVKDYFIRDYLKALNISLVKILFSAQWKESLISPALLEKLFLFEAIWFSKIFSKDPLSCRIQHNDWRFLFSLWAKWKSGRVLMKRSSTLLILLGHSPQTDSTDALLSIAVTNKRKPDSELI